MTLGPIHVLGAGKVGRALARAWRHAGLAVALRPARAGWPRRPLEAELVVLALRDDRLAAAAEALAPVVGRRAPAVVVHCAGAQSPEVLAPLRSRRVAIGRMHPLLAFADRRRPPPLAGGCAHLSGDPRAVRLAARAARAIGLRPVRGDGVNLTLYHAAAALLANGGAALAAAASELLAASGESDARRRARMLAPLLRSVSDNLLALGSPAHLTGPIRRGDAAAVAAHLAILERAAPSAAALYRALGAAQLPLARALGEGSELQFRRIGELLASHE